MERMLVEMTETQLGSDTSDNGIHMPVKEYKKGQRYIVGKELFRCFMDLKSCIIISPKQHSEENKMIQPQENKMHKPKKKRKKKAKK